MASKGIIVDHRESHVRFAISEENFNPETMKRVRDLLPGESVRTYRPRHVGRLGEAQTPEDYQGSPTGTPETAGEPSALSATPAETSRSTKTEGSAPAGTNG